MKVKGNKILFILSLLTTLGLLGILIYEIINNEFDLTTLLILLISISNIPQFIELDK